VAEQSKQPDMEQKQANETPVEQAKLTDELRERAVPMEADIYSSTRELAETSPKLKQANEELTQRVKK
jgi:hypothetical protein